MHALAKYVKPATHKVKHNEVVVHIQTYIYIHVWINCVQEQLWFEEYWLIDVSQFIYIKYPGNGRTVGGVANNSQGGVSNNYDAPEAAVL